MDERLSFIAAYLRDEATVSQYACGVGSAGGSVTGGRAAIVTPVSLVFRRWVRRRTRGVRRTPRQREPRAPGRTTALIDQSAANDVRSRALEDLTLQSDDAERGVAVHPVSGCRLAVKVAPDRIPWLTRASRSRVQGLSEGTPCHPVLTRRGVPCQPVMRLEAVPRRCNAAR